MSQKSKFGNRLALTTALAGVLFAGYSGRSAYAGTCVGAAGTYTCSGAANSGSDNTEVISYTGVLTVTTAAGFGIDTSVNGGAAFELTANGNGSLTFTDANTAAITASGTGIYAYNNTDSTLSISTSGIIFSNNVNGIDAFNNKYSTDLTVTTQAEVTGYQDGIQTRNDGSGATTITTTAAVTGTNRIGITAVQAKYAELGFASSPLKSKSKGRGYETRSEPPPPGSGTDLIINSQADVSGGEGGIFGFNLGSGVTSITTNASVIGTNDFGIFSVSGNATSNTINAMGSVTGGRLGVAAYSDYSGLVSITTAGDVVGTDYAGIYAFNQTGGVTIDAQADVSSDQTGILSYSYGSLSITTAGVVQGDAGFGIYSYTSSGYLTSITLNSPTVVSAPTSGQGVFNNYGDSDITVNDGASVLGSIILGDGSDDLTFSGGDFSGVTIFDGGDDADVADGYIDTLTFTGTSGLLVAADVINWENIVIESSAVISFDGIESLVTPNLTSTGGVDLQDGVSGDTLTLTGDFTGGGFLSLDTVADDGTGGSDLFVIEGDIIGGTTMLDIANVGGAGGQTTGDGILVVQVAGNSPADGFSMTPFMVGAYEYELVQVGSNWYLQSQDQGSLLPAIAIPTMGQWSMGLLTLLLGGFAARRLSRRRVS